MAWRHRSSSLPPSLPLSGSGSDGETVLPVSSRTRIRGRRAELLALSAAALLLLGSLSLWAAEVALGPAGKGGGLGRASQGDVAAGGRGRGLARASGREGAHGGRTSGLGRPREGEEALAPEGTMEMNGRGGLSERDTGRGSETEVLKDIDEEQTLGKQKDGGNKSWRQWEGARMRGGGGGEVGNNERARTMDKEAAREREARVEASTLTAADGGAPPQQAQAKSSALFAAAAAGSGVCHMLERTELPGDVLRWGESHLTDSAGAQRALRSGARVSQKSRRRTHPWHGRCSLIIPSRCGWRHATPAGRS